MREREREAGGGEHEVHNWYHKENTKKRTKMDKTYFIPKLSIKSNEESTLTYRNYTKKTKFSKCAPG